jgi:hypothetical protein
MRRHHVIAVAIGVVVALVVWLGRQRKASPPPADQPPPVEAPQPTTAVGGGKAPEPMPKVDDAKRAEAKRKHDEMAAQIHSVQKDREAQQVAPNKGVPAVAPQKLDADYIRGRIKDLIPLVEECYELGLREQPKLEGKLVLKFDIVGEPKLGGVVESIEYVRQNDAGILNQTLEDCLKATVETQTFAAPEKGGKTTVTYPFVFAHDEPKK